MPFFTSSFKDTGKRRNKFLVALTIFWTFFALLTIGGEAVCHHLSPDMFDRGNFSSYSPSKDFITWNTYSDRSETYEALYYGIGPAIENARKADILLLGNSMVFFGFGVSAVRDFSLATHLRVFNLSFYSGDFFPFALDTILRQNLRPPIVVINDWHFFRNQYSPYALKTKKMGYCSAWMDIFENRLSWQICSFIRPVFPSLYFGRMPSMRPRMFFQSTLDGCLVGRPSLNDRFPIVYEKDINQSVLFPEELENAERFRAEMEKRGTKVIITNVPFDENSNQKKRLAMGVCDNPWLFVKYEPFHKSILLAKALNVPLLAPTVAGLETIDGGHLTAESSEKFSRVFFKELSELPLVKTLSLHRLENPEN